MRACKTLMDSLLTEHDIQCAYFAGVRRVWPACKLIYAVPNGGERNAIVAAKLKREGVTAGIPDVNIDIPRGHYVGMRIEFKVPRRKSNHSEAQKDVQAQLIDAGYLVRVHTDAEQALRETRDYIDGRHGNFREGA